MLVSFKVSDVRQEEAKNASHLFRWAIYFFRPKYEGQIDLHLFFLSKHCSMELLPNLSMVLNEKLRENLSGNDEKGTEKVNAPSNLEGKRCFD